MILNITKSCIEANVYKINIIKIVDIVQTVNPSPEEQSKQFGYMQTKPHPKNKFQRPQQLIITVFPVKAVHPNLK